jgi:hypothetical protein
VTDEKSNDDIDALVARSLVKRGELIPTTTEEVLETSSEYEGALPPSLERYRPEQEKAAPRPRERQSALPYIGVFAAVAAAAAIFLVTRGDPEIHGERIGAPSGGPAATAPTASAPLAVPQASCESGCCGGAACKAAESAFATCPTERTCISCEGVDKGDTQYRVRLGNVAPSSGQPAAAMAELDLCVSIGATPGSPWVCEPAYEPAATRPRGRFLAKASTVDELVGGVSMELRPKGKTQVLAAWRSGIKVGVGSLCKGLSVSLQNEQHEQLGTLSMFLERTYYVELARRDDRAALDGVASSFGFGERVPRFLSVPGDVRGGRHVLALGPFDKPEAEALLQKLRESEAGPLSAGFRVANGDGYDEH